MLGFDVYVSRPAARLSGAADPRIESVQWGDSVHLDRWGIGMPWRQGAEESGEVVQIENHYGYPNVYLVRARVLHEFFQGGDPEDARMSAKLDELECEQNEWLRVSCWDKD